MLRTKAIAALMVGAAFAEYATPMKTILALLFAISATCFAADPRPGDYLKGTVSRDVQAALKKAQADNRPVWIIAWDDKFKDEPKNENIAKTHLGFFFKNPETQKIVSDNFVQVFTTMSNKSVQGWLDVEDKTHIPVIIVLNPDGTLNTRRHVRGAPAEALKITQELAAGVK